MRTVSPRPHDCLRAAAAGLLGALLGACGGGPAPGPTAAGPPAAASAAAAAPSLSVTDLVPGQGEAATAGRRVVVNYTGWLYDASAPDHKGKEFDSSTANPDHFAFTLGAGSVIKGWDQGVAGMKTGGKRRLVIPPELGYGEEGAGGVIPPGATLVFDVELLAIE